MKERKKRYIALEIDSNCLPCPYGDIRGYADTYMCSLFGESVFKSYVGGKTYYRKCPSCRKAMRLMAGIRRGVDQS